ncbi:MAG: DUF6537 domain-containing protein, partial [Actinomycetota bacterium]
SADRRLERALIAQYEADMDMVLSELTPERIDAAVALAELPLQFGLRCDVRILVLCQRR